MSTATDNVLSPHHKNRLSDQTLTKNGFKTISLWDFARLAFIGMPCVTMIYRMITHFDELNC